MFRSIGTLFLAYLCLVSGLPLDSPETAPVELVSRDRSVVVDGIDLTKLDEEGLKRFSEAEDEKLIGELDLASGQVETGLTKRPAPIILAAGAAAVRLAPYAFRAGRLLYKSVISRGALKYGRKKITQNLFSRGNLMTGYRHFNRITGGKYKRFQQGATKGFRGKVGRHNVILRNRSGKGGRGPPTLEIQTPKGGKTLYKKFRFRW